MDLAPAVPKPGDAIQLRGVDVATGRDAWISAVVSYVNESAGSFGARFSESRSRTLAEFSLASDTWRWA